MFLLLGSISAIILMTQIQFPYYGERACYRIGEPTAPYHGGRLLMRHSATSRKWATRPMNDEARTINRSEDGRARPTPLSLTQIEDVLRAMSENCREPLEMDFDGEDFKE